MNTFIEGNLENKYHTKNPISRFLMNNFIKSFKKLLIYTKEHSEIKTVCEVGVGEGELLKIALQIFPKAKFYACDLSKNEIQCSKRRESNTL